MTRDEARISIVFGCEAGLVVYRDRQSGKYLIGNLPSSPVANAWCLRRGYLQAQAAIEAAHTLAQEAGKTLLAPSETRPEFFVMEFEQDPRP